MTPRDRLEFCDLRLNKSWGNEKIRLDSLPRSAKPTVGWKPQNLSQSTPAPSPTLRICLCALGSPTARILYFNLSGILRSRRWMILRDGLQSARASTRRNLSQSGSRDSIGVRVHPQLSSMRDDAAEVRFHELLRAQSQRRRREIRLRLPPQQVKFPLEKIPELRTRLTFSLAAAAAKINASIQAKKGIQHVDVPPIQSTLSPSGGRSASPKASSGNSAALVNGEMYIADGDYIRDIEVNDLRNRYTLTKGSTQKMVNTPCVILH